MHQLIRTVNEWANHRRLYENTIGRTQLALAYIELGEFSDSILKDDKVDISAVELGDVITCLINYAVMDNPLLLSKISKILDSEYVSPNFIVAHDEKGVCLVNAFKALNTIEFFIDHHIIFLAFMVNKTPAQCLQLACDKIKFRNGKFVKF